MLMLSVTAPTLEFDYLIFSARRVG